MFQNNDSLVWEFIELPEYNEIALNEFIKNTYEVFEKQPQRDMVRRAYEIMNIDIKKLINKNNLDDIDSD